MLRATQKLIQKLLDHPKYILSFLATVTVILGSFLPGVKMDFTIEQLFSQDDPIIDRFMTFREEFAGVDNVIYLIYESDDPFSHDNLVKNRSVVEAFEGIDGVESVTSLTNIELFTEGGEYLLQPVYDKIPVSADSLLMAKNRMMSSELVKNYIISGDGEVAAILVEVDRDYNEHKGRERILKEIDLVQKRVDWEWHQAGLPVIRTRYVQYMIADNVKFLIPVTSMLIILLLLLFRSLVGLLLPLIVVSLTIIWTLGFMVASGITINIISYMIPTLLMIIGVSDSVHFLVKYFHTLKEIGHRKEALYQTVKKIGTAIFLTSLTTAIGFGALSFVNIKIVKEFGIFTAIGVFFAFIITILFIPAMLMVLKRTPESKLEAYSRGFRMRIIKQIIIFVRAYPKQIIASGLLISIIGIFGAVQMNPHSKLLEDLRPGNALLDDMHFAEERMGAVLPVEIIIEVDDGGPFEDIQDSEVMKFLDQLSQYVSQIPEVGKVASVSDYMKEIHRAMNEGDPAFYKIPESREMISQYMLLFESEFGSLMNVDYTKLRIAAQIKDINSRRSSEMEKQINDYILSIVPFGLTVEVTGTAFLALRTNNYLVKNLVGSFLIALGMITILMAFLFRSIKMALISILPNIIPMMIMAAVLGFFQIPLRPSTAMTFAIAFGIAVDDTLHYLTRYRMELAETDRHYRQANDATLMSTGVAMMSTTAILVSGFFVLTLSEFTPTIQFGLLSAITILVALVGDLTFLPALLSQVKPKIRALKD
ncbi:MMPL family transporter [Caldithrix abyssi]|nr:MMPL family transporter [Caldithrix abyssi]